MSTATTPFHRLTAADVMSRDLVCVPLDMSMRAAARLLFDRGISGAPVVDADGSLVGVLSATDFVALTGTPASPLPAPPAPAPCGFQAREQSRHGQLMVLCTLPAGECPVQEQGADEDGNVVLFCRRPDAALADAAGVEWRTLPEEAVGRHMTPEPVTVPPDASVGDLARLLSDVHIHRVIVVGEGRKPIGIVSSTDILAAVANGRN